MHSHSLAIFATKASLYPKYTLILLRKSLIISLIVFCLFINACSGLFSRAPKRHVASFTPTNFSQIAGWEQDDALAAVRSFCESCKLIGRRNIALPISKYTQIGGRVGDWAPLCQAALKITTEPQARAFWSQNFTPYRVSSEGRNQGKVTGYFEIELLGSRRQSKRFRYPIHMPPPNLDKIRGARHIKKSAILAGSLRHQKLELAWIEDLHKLSLLHIQGSGVIKFAEGGQMRIGYAGRNGHELTLSKSKSVNNVRKARSLNQSYIFFHERKNNCALGCQGSKLTGERSGALDIRLYPLGTPIWIDSVIYNHSTLPKLTAQRYRRLIIAQDRGGAINGPLRADLFFGSGDVAEKKAFRMNSPGYFFALFPKKVKIPKKYVFYQ